MFNMMANGMKMQRAAVDAEGDKPAEKFDLVQAFRSGEGQHLMRVTFASQLEQMEMMAAGGDGSTLLEGRNEKCLKVLRQELAKGHKRIGIYYGAAHLTHMEKRLIEGFGFKKVGHEWLVAWDCKKRPDPIKDPVLAKEIRTCKKQLNALAKVGMAYRKAHGAEALPASVADLAKFAVDGELVYTGPKTDPWGSDYQVKHRKVGNRWRASSAGPDKQWATDDDLVVEEPRR